MGISSTVEDVELFPFTLKLLALNAENLPKTLGERFILCNADSDIDRKFILNEKETQNIVT